MLILGIESSTAQVGCAVGGHEGVLASAHSARGRRHAESLAPQIDFVRRQARIELNEISVVAVDLGPGLYTGLRVGIASGMAMAHALGVPMIGVASLDLLAWPVRYSRRLIVAVLDARRGEIFHAMYRQVPGGVQRPWVLVEQRHGGLGAWRAGPHRLAGRPGGRLAGRPGGRLAGRLASGLGGGLGDGIGAVAAAAFGPVFHDGRCLPKVRDRPAGAAPPRRSIR